MQALRPLRSRPNLFFRLSGIRVLDFNELVKKLHPIWIGSEKKRLSCPNRKRAIGSGVK